MNTTQTEKNCHKVLFRVKGKLAMILELKKKGYDIRMNEECTHACACFDNVLDYNQFKSMINSLPSSVSA